MRHDYSDATFNIEVALIKADNSLSQISDDKPNAVRIRGHIKEAFFYLEQLNKLLESDVKEENKLDGSQISSIQDVPGYNC